jgi:hypothetical protein
MTFNSSGGIAMLLRLVRRDCDDGKTCPALYRTEGDSVVVQGWAVLDSDLLTQMALPAGSAAVEVPSGLLAEVLGSWPALRPTGHGTVLVPGMPVKDAEMLRQLRLPAGERAVQVPGSHVAGVLRAC